MSITPRISNAEDALRISLYLSWIDALLALITSFSILPLRTARFALMVETITRIRIYVNVLLKHLSILMWNVSHAFYPNISILIPRNVEIVHLIWYTISALINAHYVLLKDHFLVIKNVFHAPQINFTIRLLLLVRNAVSDVNTMQKKMNVSARIKPYSSMALFALHAIIPTTMISTKTNAKIVVKTRSIVSPVRSAKPALK